VLPLFVFWRRHSPGWANDAEQLQTGQEELSEDLVSKHNVRMGE